MVSEKFRYQLRQEAEQWCSEGLINQELYDTFAQRYQFKDLDTAARNRFVMILLGLGSILLGLAVITFIAANWQVWSRGLKVILLLGVFVGVNVTGFYLWRTPGERWQSRLGQGLLLLGSLILGANMALMSQMFHSSGSVYQLYLVWGLGVVAMAASLRLTMLGMLAVILTGIGYSRGLTNALWNTNPLDPFQIGIQHMPLLATLAFIPLAYWCRSRWLFGMAAILAIGTLPINLTWHLSDFASFSYGFGVFILAIAFTLPPLLLWAYSNSLWGLYPNPGVSFRPIARALSVIFFSGVLYVASFHGYWRSNSLSYLNNDVEILWQDWLAFLDGLVFLGLTIFAWWRLGYQNKNYSFWRIDLTTTIFALMILTYAVLLSCHFTFTDLGVLATFVCNALLAVLAIGLIREALAEGMRRGFWWGILILVLQILSRMVEYNTDLVFKAVVLFLCGIGIIVAGLWFESHLKRLSK